MTPMFVNREDELRQLRGWWGQPGNHFGLVWGRRRVGKTFLLSEFSRDLPAIFHTARGADPREELADLSREAAGILSPPYRDLVSVPFRDWRDAIETLAAASERRPMLLVIDEFQELRAAEPSIEGTLRAVWDRVIGSGRSKLRILLAGSAVRTMQALQERRAPLFGRFDLRRQIHPFRPREAASMLAKLKPADRARVWGLVGGMPSYLAAWDAARSFRANLFRLFCTPGGQLLEEGTFVLETEGGVSGVARQTLFAIATGKNRFSEIVGAVRASEAHIAQVLRNLETLGLVEREVPVTEDPRRTQGGRVGYRIRDNFLAFWLGSVSRMRGDIDRGLGRTVLPVLAASIDDHMGPRYEDAFREHLRRLAERGELDPEVVAVGRFWSRREDPVEIDAVVLAGRRREAMLVGEAKWARSADARRIRVELERKAEALPKRRTPLRYAVCAREEIRHPEGILAVTAREIFSP